jgi:hypothetical protein
MSRFFISPHFPHQANRLKCLYLALMSADPNCRDRQRRFGLRKAAERIRYHLRCPQQRQVEQQEGRKLHRSMNSSLVSTDARLLSVATYEVETGPEQAKYSLCRGLAS